MDDPLDDLLRDAILAAADRSFEALAVAGADAVKRFHDLLAGEHAIDLPKGRDRELIDNMTDISCRLAARFPDDYLAAFNNRRWVASGFVLTGLGYTRRQEAQPLLIDALQSDAPGVTRLSAASALATIPGPEAVRALLQALDDDDYLVQYHAIRSLGAIGDRTSLDRLIPLATNPPNRGIGEVAARAVKSLTDRLSP